MTRARIGNAFNRATRLLALGGAVVGAGVLLLIGRLTLDVVSLDQLARASATGGPTGIITHTTTADFTSGCTTRANLTILSFSGGEARLQPTIEDYFDGPAINESAWLTGTVVEQGGTLSPTIVAGELRLNGNFLRSQMAFTDNTQSGRFFEVNALLRTSASLSATNSDLGFARENRPFSPFTNDTASRVFFGLYDPPAAVNDLRVRLRDGNPPSPTDINIPDPDLLQYHRLRLEWDTTETRYYVDDNLNATITSTNVLTSWVWLYSHNPTTSGPLSEMLVDWVRAGVYPASGTLVSCALDAGGIVNWASLTSTTVLPTGTGVAFRTRTSLDAMNWSAWQAVSGATIVSPSGRYLQYEASLTTASPLRSPELHEVVLRHYGPTEVRLSPNPATVNPGATQVFTPQAYDVNNQPLTGLTYTLALVNGGGSALADTTRLTFTAQLTPGTFNNTISATLNTVAGPLTGSASVIIPDLPPTAFTTGPYTANEGALLNLNGSGADPNGGAVSFAWDLDNNGSFETFGASVSNTWPDNGAFVVGFRAREDAGAQQATSVTTTVTVNNVAPAISNVTNSGPVAEGSAATITVAASDVAADPLQYEFDCDDNGSYDIGPQAGNAAQCTMIDNPSRTVNVRVTDGDGGSDADSTTVTVSNVAPSLNSITDNGPRPEGSVLTITLNASDPAGAADPLLFEFDCDNSGDYEISQATNAAGCVFFEQGAYPVPVRVSDGDGGVVTGTRAVTITNAPPQVNSVTNSGPINEGGSALITISASDPAGSNDPLQYEFDCNNDGTYDYTQTTSSRLCNFADNGVFTVGVRVSDDDTGVAVGGTSVTVNNLSPSITNVTNGGPLPEGGSVSIVVTATDVAGAADPLQYEFDCNDNGVYEIGPQAGNSASCTFGDDGGRVVGVRVTDGDGGSATATTLVTVNNLAPIVHGVLVSSPRVVNEPVTLTVIASDPAGINDPLQYAFDCNNDGLFETGPQASSAGVCVFTQTGLFTVPVRVTDGDGGSTPSSASVNVNTVRVYLPLVLKTTP
jgi:hypothetical protein